MELDEIKTLVSSFRELGLSYEEFCNASKQCDKEAKSLKSLIGDPTKEPTDSWLIKTGIALIAIPVPGISELMGATMVAAGLVKRRMKKYTVADVYAELRDTMKEIEKLRQGQ